MYRSTITKEEIAELPLAVYEGEVVVVEREEELEDALRPLLKSEVIGFDTETRPAFKKGVLYPISLLQLASEKYVVLIRLNKVHFSDIIKNLLETPNIIKVGVGIHDDLQGLKRLSKFTPRSFVDLQSIVSKYGIADKSFAKLMAIVFGVHISKRQRITNWAADELTPAQIAYAATDAWGAVRLYNKLIQANDCCRIER